jgi:hypothetical protein
VALDPSDLAILNRRVRSLVSESIIAEHRADPFGERGHSAELTELLHFLRRNPDPELPRYLLVREGAPSAWRVGRRGARPGDPVEPVGTASDATYATRADAEHAVFLLRLSDYGVAP